MTLQEMIRELHRLGYNVVINLWADDEDYLVNIWQDDKLVAHGVDRRLYAAIRRALLRIEALRGVS